MRSKMKLLTMVIAIGLCIAAAVTVSAYSDDVFTNAGMKSVEGFYTRITDTQGDIHTYDGVIDAEIMEKSNAVGRISSYEIYQGEKQIIQVTLNDITPQNGANLFGVPGTPSSNGYYAVKFELSAADNTEVFLTGLTNANLDLVQEKLIAAILENSQFTMESLDFIDAEKTDLPSDGDDLLCWAASTANMLTFTGWGEKAGFSGTDELLDLFVEHFTDVGSHQLYGLEWFFNGVYQMKGLSGWAQEKNPGSGGGYLKQYASERVINYVNMVDRPEKIATGMNQLENGCGMGLGISWIDKNGNRNGGHAITCWGYLCDKDFAQEDREYYQALIVSDSDSDMQADPNRRTAPNKLQVLNMSVYQDDKYDSWKFDGYGDVGVLEDFITLIPYSEDVEQETDSSAALDKNTTPDLVINRLILTNDALDTSYQGQNFTVGYISAIPVFENTGDVDFTEPFDYTVKVNGSAAITSNYTYTGGIAAYGLSDENQTEKAVFLTGLPVGHYTLTITVNPKHTAREAYYYNNEYTYDFVISKQKYSPPDVPFNADIGEIQNGYAEAAITYPGLEEEFDFLRDPGATYYLMRSYFKNGAWQNWETVSVSGEAPPDTCTVYAAGERVKFRLLMEPKDPTMPVQQVYSEAYSLQYKRFEAAADETNTSEPSPVERGGKTLKDGEQFAFQVRNVSTDGSGAAECNAMVYAEKGDEKIELFRRDNISLNPGESTNIIRVSSWTAELSGSYEITVEIESAAGTSETVLGTLRVGEKISFEVTIDGDVTDPYDGETSLREAVASYREYGGSNDRITIAEGKIVCLEQPIDIDYRIIIECPRNSAEPQPGGAAITGNGSTQLFRIEQTGSLIITRIMLMDGYGKNYGGAVENNGGVVMLQECMLFYNKSGLSGGAVYSNGGHMILYNCSLSLNQSGYGGAAGTDKNATINLVNCNVLSNSSNSGAIYNNGGTVNAIYSTFTDNNADSEGGGAITSPGGTTNTAGCIITSNGSLDLSGNINVFGSYITAADTKVSVDSLTQTGGCEEFFLLDAEGQPVWNIDEEELFSLFYLPQLSSRIHDGVYIKNDGNGKLVISADGVNWEETGINSAFSDEAYETDMLGNPHDRLFGSYAKTCDTVQIIGLENNSMMLYVPEAQEASLITAGYNKEGALMEYKEYRQNFHAGTNRVSISDINGDHADAMLWESLNSLMPLCDKYHLY